MHRGIAKLVRHWILNPAFVGSSPATPAKGVLKKTVSGNSLFLFTFGITFSLAVQTMP